MTSLQRSSVSFRRQGSSGRIWEEPENALHLKNAVENAGNRSPKSPKVKNRTVSFPAKSPRAMDSSDDCEGKRQPGCAFSAVFRPCLKPSPTS